MSEGEVQAKSENADIIGIGKEEEGAVAGEEASPETYVIPAGEDKPAGVEGEEDHAFEGEEDHDVEGEKDHAVEKGEDHAPNFLPSIMDPDEDTYVYRDFSAMPAEQMAGVGSLHPQSLQAQKLPAKLAAMLADHELISVIQWSPHGRCWRVLNRDMFAEHALPRYFGHKNYASFVRIVNAWGFRRITRGPDRDSYYHELFLRGRPDLHQRMKRLSPCHRKTPVHKEDKCPDFYELAKANPLPEVPFLGGRPVMMIPNMAQLAQANQFSPLRMGMGLPAVGSVAHLGGMGMNEQVLSMFQNEASRSNGVHPAAVNQSGQTLLPRLDQLQKDNEDLRRRIMEMEQAQGGGGQANANTGASNPATTATNNDALQQELARMQRDFMMRSGTPMNNGMNTQFAQFNAAGGMNGFSHDEMLLQAMRENQMGYPQQNAGQGGAVAAADQPKVMMDWVTQQQQGQQQPSQQQ